MNKLQKGQKLTVSTNFNVSYIWDNKSKVKSHILFFSADNAIVKDTSGVVSQTNKDFNLNYGFDLSKVNPDVNKIELILTGPEDIKNLKAKISNDDGELFYIPDEPLNTVSLLQFYKRNNEWKVNALGRIHKSPGDFLKHYNINEVDLDSFKINDIAQYQEQIIIKQGGLSSKSKEKKIEKSAQLPTENIITLDQLKTHSKRVLNQKDAITSEEGTKTALILPFIQMLGYDIFDTKEVNPEFSATFGIKKGEKVDYAILKDDEPIMFIECKSCNEVLTFHNEQLYRYFNTTQMARFGILTNGIKYNFYTDLESPNIMDKEPFFSIDFTEEITEEVINGLNKFHKNIFNPGVIFTSAKLLRFSNELKEQMVVEFAEPSENFIKYFLKKVKTVSVNAVQAKEIFEKVLRQALNEVAISELKTEEIADLQEQKSRIVTTSEELEGYQIVKAIIGNKVDPKRVSYKDTVHYFGISIDSNTHKTFCRLWFNGKTKYIGILNEERIEVKYPIVDLNDIYKFSEDLISSVGNYS